MEAFIRMTNRKISSQLRGQIKTAVARRWDSWNLLFNCAASTFDHNDVTHINKGLELARLNGNYRVVKKIMTQIVPFPFSDEEGFHGKRKTNMYNKLADKYESVLRTLIDEQQVEDTKPKAPKEWVFDTALENFFKKCNKEGISNDDVLAGVIDHNKLAIAA